ncbi:hypothetical protein IC582_013730 [Cucumis melo]
MDRTWPISGIWLQLFYYLQLTLDVKLIHHSLIVLFSAFCRLVKKHYLVCLKGK